MTQNAQSRPFDERAALEDLERLADKIQITRRQRARAVAEFETFVKSFKQDRAAAPPPPPAVRNGEAVVPPVPVPPAAIAAPPVQPSRTAAAAPSVPAPVVPATSPAATSSLPRVEEFGQTSTLHESDGTTTGVSGFPRPEGLIASSAVVRTALARLTQNRQTLAMTVGALVLLLLLLVWQPWRSAPPPAASAPEQSGSVPVPTPSAVPTPSTGTVPATQPAPAAPAVPRRAVNIELTTIREVWTRVIVDDRRAIERVLPAGQKIPLGADREINIRAGDAGAIRLSVDGKDQGPLGRDGIAVTKVFTAKR